MKRTNIYSLGLALAAAVLFSSCYKDEGNYDYRFDSMNEIKGVSFTPASITSISGQTIEFTQPLEGDETHRVEANVEQSLAENAENLEFKWSLSYENADGETVKETQTTAGYLDVLLPADRLITYTVMLEVRDKTTDLAYYTNLIVKTRPIFQNSLFVLHQENSESKLGNIETVGTETNVRTDAYKTVNASATGNPFSNTAALGYSTYTDSRDDKRALAMFNKDGSAFLYDPFGFTDKNFGSNYVLPLSNSKTPPFIVDRVVYTGDASNGTAYQMLISKDGRFYIANQYMCYFVPGEYTYDTDFHLPQSDYTVTAGTITSDKNVLWDSKGNRFIYQNKFDSYYARTDDAGRSGSRSYNSVMDAEVSFDAIGSTLSPVGKTAVYAYVSYKENYDEAHPFFIFKDSDGGYYLYELSPASGSEKSYKDDKDEAVSTGAMFTIEGRRLSNFTPSNDKTIVYDTWFSTNYIFYANGSNLYRYNTSNGDNTLLYSAPEGWSITLVKPRSYDSGTYTGDLGRYLSLALSSGSKGAVAELYLNTAADVESVLPSATTLYEGFGTILDLQFANDFYWELPDYMQ